MEDWSSGDDCCESRPVNSTAASKTPELDDEVSDHFDHLVSCLTGHVSVQKLYIIPLRTNSYVVQSISRGYTPR